MEGIYAAVDSADTKRNAVACLIEARWGKPARQYLIEIRNALGLPDKATNTTRSLGAQVFGVLGK
jgi:hypothetical protein